MRRWVCLVLVLLGMSGSAAPAYAEIAWWDFIEQLSGPGPFTQSAGLGVFTIDTGVACRLAEPREGGSRWISLKSPDCLLSPTRVGPRRVQDFIALRVGSTATEKSRALFEDRPEELRGAVTAWTIEARYKHRFDAAIALGAGGGVVIFSGDTLDGSVARTVLTPLSVEFTPIGLFHQRNAQRLAGLVGLRFEQMVVVGGLEARDFNQSSTSSFKSDDLDPIRRFSITVDISPFLFRQSRSGE